MWFIKKDGLWLMGYQQGEIKEFMRDGKLVSVPTCIYGERLKDAMPFENEISARNMAKMIGGTLMVINENGRPVKEKRK